MLLRDALMLPEFTALSDADALALFLSEDTYTSQQLWSYDIVVKDARFGITLANTLYAAITATSGEAAALLYVVHGIDLSLAASQAGLDAIAAAEPTIADQCALLKWQGIWIDAKWEGKYMLSNAPLLTDITAARLTIATEADLQTFADRYNAMSYQLSQRAITLAQAITGMSGV